MGRNSSFPTYRTPTFSAPCLSTRPAIIVSRNPTSAENSGLSVSYLNPVSITPLNHSLTPATWPSPQVSARATVTSTSIPASSSILTIAGAW